MGGCALLTILASLLIVKKKDGKNNEGKKKEVKKNEGKQKKDKGTEMMHWHRWSHLFGGEDRTDVTQTGQNKATQTGVRQDRRGTSGDKIHKMIRTEPDQDKKRNLKLYDKVSRMTKTERKRLRLCFVING